MLNCVKKISINC